MFNLYDVDKNYVDFIQTAETTKRGFTRVPNMDYAGREQKFLCGIVLQINGMNYYVGATSYAIPQTENILIEFKDDKKNPIKGSLRFNYMFPIPTECVKVRIIDNEQNPIRRTFLAKQLHFFNNNVELIQRKALSTYKKVIGGYSPFLVKNSCDFSLIESACLEYCKIHSFKLHPAADNLERISL
ncbi:MAG: type III toxin-antitoxin system ToxN/AbiQ family toxin, partial [Ruthenibacterium sp.]